MGYVLTGAEALDFLFTANVSLLTWPIVIYFLQRVVSQFEYLSAKAAISSSDQT